VQEGEDFKGIQENSEEDVLKGILNLYASLGKAALNNREDKTTNGHNSRKAAMLS